MYFAEVYIVLKDGISLEAARWVGDTLAMRLIRIGDVEHASSISTQRHMLRSSKRHSNRAQRAD
jgi:hypothetical protein